MAPSSSPLGTGRLEGAPAVLHLPWAFLGENARAILGIGDGYPWCSPPQHILRETSEQCMSAVWGTSAAGVVSALSGGELHEKGPLKHAGGQHGLRGPSCARDNELGGQVGSPNIHRTAKSTPAMPPRVARENSA